jgi:hypothetical protein
MRTLQATEVLLSREQQEVDKNDIGHRKREDDAGEVATRGGCEIIP